MNDRDRNLTDYSANQLYRILHWTSRTDLMKALNTEDSELWKNLVDADRALRKFSPEQLTKIIELYQNSSRKLTFE